LNKKRAARGEDLIVPIYTRVDAENAVRALEADGVPRMDAIKRVARERGLGKREIYKQLTS